MVHPLPTRLWSKEDSDIFYLNVHQYLILVDQSNSEVLHFIEVEELDALTAHALIKVPKGNVVRYGIMDELISDNSPQCASSEFWEFIAAYNIRQST